MLANKNGVIVLNLGFVLNEKRVDVDLLIPNTSNSLTLLGEYNIYLSVDAQYILSQQQTQLYGRVEHKMNNESEGRETGRKSMST